MRLCCGCCMIQTTSPCRQIYHHSANGYWRNFGRHSRPSSTNWLGEKRDYACVCLSSYSSSNLHFHLLPQIHFFAHLTMAKVISADSMFSLLQSFTAVLDEFGVSHSRAKKAALCAAEGLMIVCIFPCSHSIIRAYSCHRVVLCSNPTQRLTLLA